jgi:hypothetical protein
MKMTSEMKIIFRFGIIERRDVNQLLTRSVCIETFSFWKFIFKMKDIYMRFKIIYGMQIIMKAPAGGGLRRFKRM